MGIQNIDWLRWKFWQGAEHAKLQSWHDLGRTADELVFHDGAGGLEDGDGTSIGASLARVGANEFQSVLGAAARGNSNAHWPTWLLDAASTEIVGASINVPEGWATFDIDLVWANAGAGTGDVVWRIDHARAGAGTDLTTATTLPAAVTATAGAQNIAVVTAAVTGVTAPSAAQLLALRVVRVGGNAADTLANDAHFVGVILRKAS